MCICCITPTGRRVSDAPDLNLGNARGAAVLAAIGCEGLRGLIAHRDMPTKLQTAMRTLNSPVQLAKHTVKPLQLMSPAGLHDVAGIDAGYLAHRLKDLIKVLVYARDHKLHVAWF